MTAWSLLSQLYKGWTLEDMKNMSPRERENWLELARESGKVVRK